MKFLNPGWRSFETELMKGVAVFHILGHSWAGQQYSQVKQ
jgi:hypothetical protein